MTLPSSIKDEFIDSEIRLLVINLNRMPDVHTRTTCQGHILRETRAWPTKDGWIYFHTPVGEYQDLVESIYNLNSDYPFIEFIARKDFPVAARNFYSVFASYEPHHDYEMNDIFSLLSPAEQDAYFQRAEKREKEIFGYWHTLEKLTYEYILEKILPASGKNSVEELPYR